MLSKVYSWKLSSRQGKPKLLHAAVDSQRSSYRREHGNGYLEDGLACFFRKKCVFHSDEIKVGEELKIKELATKKTILL